MEVKRFKVLKEDRGENENVMVQHIYREGNTLADYFANLVVHFVGTVKYNTNQEVLAEGKKIIIMEKNQIPNLRIRQYQNKRGIEINNNTINDARWTGAQDIEKNS
ncbi:hypothetical protein HAX54_041345 [Datura stramonium]|uniref:RNase H type-1 domain-containing protein n=1 Tax=Datura stramonium TaxID=4076 RepID=A0ABS8SL45_DATST|nr:hypothetical protein [Datura stramonium]